MAGIAVREHPVSAQTMALLPLALARPQDALAAARSVLDAGPSAGDASVAHQVAGIVLRDFGDVSAAIGELRTAARLARSARSPQRRADVLATLGIALIQAGRTRSGLANLEMAVRLASGPSAGRVLQRRGGALAILGRHREALADLRRAAVSLRRAGDLIWEARALTWLGLSNLALGSTERADANFSAAERLWAATNQDLESAYAIHNRGLVAFRSGNLPLALDHLDQAAERYHKLGTPMPDLSIDRCAVLIAAGLPREALESADAAIGAFGRPAGQPTKRAELLLTAANAALAAADPATALMRAQASRRLFGSQQRAWWRARADLVLLRARYAADGPSAALLRSADVAAARLEELGWEEAPQARLLAGRVALGLGRPADAECHLATAARACRGRGPALLRLNGWLAEALRADAAGDRRRLVNACTQGLDLLDEHRLTFGASELRAQATSWGAELAELAQRSALRSGRPRALLAWSERWRATALAVPAVRPVDDKALQADLAAVRDVASRLEKARSAGRPVASLQREQLRLERLIRARVLRASTTVRAAGPGRAGGVPRRRAGRIPVGPGHALGRFRFDAAALLAEIGAGRLVQIVAIGGDLHVLVCGEGRVRQVSAGRMDDAAREVSFARLGLARLARRRGVSRDQRAGPHGSALAILEETGRRLEALILGRATRALGDGPVVIVPPGRLHAVPWAVLPSLRDRAVSVAPSAGAWLRARAIGQPPGQRVVLVRGPAAGSWGAEVPALAAAYPDAAVFSGSAATVSRVLRAMDGASLAHVAAHGTFRADNPMFSSLRLGDGPLTVHDLEMLRRAPYRLILSSCDSGLLAPAGADELLGLTSSLTPLGTAGIAASLVPINDIAAAGLMLALHQRLRSGGTLAEALRDARADASDDPVQTATAWSFIALGAA
jgi:CHAT domain